MLVGVLGLGGAWRRVEAANWCSLVAGKGFGSPEQFIHAEGGLAQKCRSINHLKELWS